MSSAGAGGAAPSATPISGAFQKGQVWEGVYTCQTEAGARLWIHSANAQQISATLEFFPLTTGQLWPYGRTKTDSTWEKDVLHLRETTWQVQPLNFGLPQLMKVELRENGRVALLSFTREDFEKYGCTGARFNLLRTW